MERIYKYSILIATPDDRRGERVNIGLAIFNERGVDFRLRHASTKLRALTGRTWDEAISATRSLLEALGRDGRPAEDILADYSLFGGAISASPPGWFRLSRDGEAYETAVSQLLSALVEIPAAERVQRPPRIITEMTAAFRKIRLMAAPRESIQSRKIVRNYAIEGKEGLTADFAMQNGKFHVASALDLRKQSASLDEAAYKSIVLDKARKIYKRKANTLGVYAVDPDSKKQFSQNIELLADYSNDVFNWQDWDERARLIKLFSDASHIRGPVPFRQLT